MGIGRVAFWGGVEVTTTLVIIVVVDLRGLWATRGLCLEVSALRLRILGLLEGTLIMIGVRGSLNGVPAHTSI